MKKGVLITIVVVVVIAIIAGVWYFMNKDKKAETAKPKETVKNPIEKKVISINNEVAAVSNAVNTMGSGVGRG